MAQYKDIITKQILKTIARDLSIYLLNISITSDIKLIDKEFSRIEKRETDILFLNDNNIIHIEIQNNNDKNMQYRMLRYYSDILSEYKDYNIIQYVIYMGKDKCNIKTSIQRDKLDYSYNLIDMKNVSCEKFLNSNEPASVSLSILCDFDDKDKQEVVNTILKRLRDVCIDDVEFRTHFKMVEILSTNRGLEEAVKKGEDMLQIDIEKLPSYEIGYERGIEWGEQRGIERGIEKGIEKGEHIAKTKSAIIMVKEFGLDPNEVAKKLELPLEVINQEINKQESLNG